jgi:predicted nucleic acid-binding protein
LLDRVVEDGAVVPALWLLEVGNALLLAARHRRLSLRERDEALVHLIGLQITIDDETLTRAWNTTLNLADRFRLTLYDACYLELAQRRQLPLATLDRELRAAGRKLGIELLGA